MPNKPQTKTEHRNQNVLLLFLTIAFTATSMLAASQPILVNILVNVILPVIILAFCKLVFFERLKLTTLTLLRIAIVFSVFNILDRQLFVNIVLIFLFINIMEATFTDIFRYKKYFNGVSGIVLAVSIIFLRGSWIDLTHLTDFGFFAKFMHMYEFHAPTAIGTVCWIIAYTIWNWVFVTNEFSDSVAKLHVGILAAPILGSLITGNPGFWLAFRAGSLAYGGCFQIAEKEFVEENLKSSVFSKFVAFTKKTGVQIALMIINIVLLALACFL
ncbi:MAG: hypothetical protein RSC96_01635 [Oscillospiraceae bacterium]